MNLNRKVVEGSIVAGMLVAMTAATSITGRVVSTANTNVISDVVSMAQQQNDTLSAGIIKEISYVEEANTSEAGISIEQSDAQVVALAGESVETDTIQAGATAVMDTEQADTAVVTETEQIPEAEAGQDIEADQKVNMSAEVTVAEDTANVIQSDAVAEQLKAQETVWENRLMPSVNEYLNIRSAGDENADIVGKLYKGDAAEIIERGDVWTHIKSGSVEGYVLNEYCTFGLDAYAQAKQDCQTEAKVKTGGLRLRTEPSEEAKVVDAAYEGQIFTVDTKVSPVEGWVAVEYDKQVAYVSAQYVSVDISVGNAISIEEERAAQATEAAEKEEQQSKGANKKEAVAASADETTVLGALIQLEAGSECYEGKVAVGAVVMNRVRSGSYPNSISGVVYQGGQFTTAASVNGVITNGVSGSCMQAAQEAINGTDNTNGCVSFRRVSSGRAGVVIGNHVFF